MAPKKLQILLEDYLDFNGFNGEEKQNISKKENVISF